MIQARFYDLSYSEGMRYFLCLILLGSWNISLAETFQNDRISFTKSRDPITDYNTSRISLAETNQQDQAYFTIRCSNRDQNIALSWLSSSHELLSEKDYQLGYFPAVTIRIGDQAAQTLPNSDLTRVINSSGLHNSRGIGLSYRVTQKMSNGLAAGQPLAVRIHRSTGRPLTYMFSPEGFKTAWNTIDQCDLNDQPSTKIHKSNKNATAPKLHKWYFTTCRDAQTNTMNTGLLAGRKQWCELAIEADWSASHSLSSAVLSYELEYNEAGETKKIPLSEKDIIKQFRRKDNRFLIDIPLHVRDRSDRTYTRIYVKGKLYFKNNSSKTIYEPLSIFKK